MLDLYISLLLLLVLYSYIYNIYTIIISNIDIVQFNGYLIFYEISIKKSLLLISDYDVSSLNSDIAKTNNGFYLWIIGDNVIYKIKLFPTSSFI